MASYRGSCACGAIRYQADALPGRSEHCHCGLCQQAVGEPVVLSVSFPESAFRWLGNRPVFYASPGQGQRGFCDCCGSAVCTLDSGLVRVNVDTLDRAGGIAPRSHVHARYARWPVALAAAG